MQQLKTIPASSLVYVDECGISEWLYREYARAPRGDKVEARISGKKFKRTNIVAGICCGDWVAPMEYDGTTDRIMFEFWFEHYLLQEVKAGTTIILDNATFHRKSILPGLAQSRECNVLFLPPYSPDLNPIEMKWAWLKRSLRSILPLFPSFDDALWNIF